MHPSRLPFAQHPYLTLSIAISEDAKAMLLSETELAFEDSA
jgi:hypothetical protein